MAYTDAERLRMLQADLENATRERDRQTNPANRQALQQAVDGVQREIARLRSNPSPETYTGGPSSQRSATPPAVPGMPTSPRTQVANATINGQDIGTFVGNILQQGMQSQQDYIAKQQDATAQAANNQAAGTIATADRTNKQMANADRQQTAAGLNPADEDNMYYKAMAALTGIQQQYAPARAEYDKYAQATILDDPITWLMGRLGGLESSAAKVNAISDQYSMVSDDINNRMLLNNTARNTIQVNTQEDNTNIAKFQAQQQIAEGNARMAEIGAVGARATMMSASMLGENARKDQKSSLQTSMEQLQEEKVREALEQSRRTREEQDRLAALTGNTVSATTVSRMPPEDREQATQWSQSGIASPSFIRKYGQGLRMQNPVAYNTAGILDDQVQKRVGQFMQARKSLNPSVSGMAPKNPKDDEQFAWEQLKAEQELANKSRGTAGAEIFPLNDPKWDTTPNPLKVPNNMFIQSLKTAQAAGAPVPVPAGNIMVQMLSRMASIPSAINQNTGEIKGDQERQALGAIGELFNKGTLKDANGQPLSAEAYAAMISQYYTAAASWNYKRQGLASFGYAPQQQYLAAVPFKSAGGVGVDKNKVVNLQSATEIANWLSANKKSAAVVQQIESTLNKFGSRGPFGLSN